MHKGTVEHDLEKHQIVPNFSMDMESSSYFDSDGDTDIMMGFYEQIKIEAAASRTNKILPITKKLRVRIKRLSRDVLQRYMKKSSPPKIG